jgi:hypothetical protein
MNIKLDLGLEFRDIEPGYLYARVFTKDAKGKNYASGLLPHAFKMVEISRQSARCQVIISENVWLRASSAELLTRMDDLAGKMKAMHRWLDSQIQLHEPISDRKAVPYPKYTY